MPGYGLAPAEAGLLEWAWAKERLAGARNYFVATVGAGGRPHVMPVWAVWLGDVLVFSTDTGSRKARNLAANAACTVAIEGADEAVILEGDAVAGIEAGRMDAFLAAYRAKYDFELTADQLAGVFTVTPRRAFGFIEAAERFGAAATRWTFDA
ncbi:MAG: pyridoxamine 5'-phosphate oxidase family protein [Dehalococcoidia bacterium]|nr:pyridoxamine 5'-phosphate oxidase family protein [Dehalococcoidia bacterium]